MQFDPLNRPNWEEMIQHSFFTETDNKIIPLEIIFDEEPPQGIEFKNGKIYVNTKNPDLYQDLHQQAIKKYIDENKDDMDAAMNNILVEQSSTKELFPRISKDLSKQNNGTD